MKNTPTHVVRTPFLPTYQEVRSLLDIWNGKPKPAIKSMMNAIYEQTGTPQDPVDWTAPDEWIAERLTGTDREFAQEIWTGSGKQVNPRHVFGSYLFINTHELLTTGPDGTYSLTPKGKRFKDGDQSIERELDEAEGLPKLLSILAAHSPSRRGDLLADWRDFLASHSRLRTENTVTASLRERILNLVERGFISRSGNTYTITKKGIAYASAGEEAPALEPHQQVMSALKSHNDQQLLSLRKRLGNMHPYRFESLVKDLLEAMDYEDVVVTKQSGDKGVDVVANYEFGITQVREVVQVKRHQGSITRPILDQLRGALPYHHAIRGTIITLGKFAQGCKDAAFFPGAAPITLIDGDKLIELMVKHEVGVKKRPQTLVEIDEAYFAGNAANVSQTAPNEVTADDSD